MDKVIAVLIAIFLVFGILFVIAISTKTAFSQQLEVSCADETSGQATLAKNYGESVLFTGVFSDNKYILHFFINSETGTWSFVSLNTTGQYCLIYSGDGLTPYIVQEEQRAEVH